MNPSIPVVIEIDDSVDVIELPIELATRAQTLTVESDVPRLLEVMALLVARLGPDVALPVLDDWMNKSPGHLADFPPELRHDLITGAIGARSYPPPA
jgi:hypothetical protein